MVSQKNRRTMETIRSKREPPQQTGTKTQTKDYVPKARGSNRSEDQHGVSITIEPVTGLDRAPVGVQNALPPGEGGDQDQKGRTG